MLRLPTNSTKKLALFVILSLVICNLSFIASPVHAAAAPAPQPCFNPVKTDNLTDNYITDDKGDPPGPEENDNKLVNPLALKFTLVFSGPIGTAPHRSKNMTFAADFSKLQAIFGAPVSNSFEGNAQDPTGVHQQADLVSPNGIKNPLNFQGPSQKSVPTVVTDTLRQKYVNYVAEKPSLAESSTKYTDNKNTAGSAKNVSDLVNTFGLPNPPEPSQDRTNWNNTWGKYWEKLPTVYNEFYIGRLEFREFHGTYPDPAHPGQTMPLIEAVKSGVNGACNKFNALRTVEFPVPNFFRTAATSGNLNLTMVPVAAQSTNNDLMDIKGAITGVQASTVGLIQYCLKLARDNPISNAIKKAVKISLENLNPVKNVYAAVGASGLSTSNQTCDTSTGRVSVRFNWTPQPDGGFFTKDVQWLDLSLTNDNFSSSYIGTSAPPSKTATSYTTGANGGQIGSLDPGKTHYWRINTRSSLDGLWYPSPTDNFTTIPCSIKILVQNATNLTTANQTCDTNTGRVNISFGWTAAEQGGLLVRDSQWLDLSLTNDNFQSAYVGTSSPPNKDAISYATGQNGGQIGSLDPGKTHYWRINTHYLNENWHVSSTESFTTIPCSIVQNATYLNVTNQICDHNTAQITVTFNWTPGQQTGLLVRDSQWLDISFADDNFTSPYVPTSNPPSKDAITYTTAQAGGQIGQLVPAKTHYWRINTHYLNENWHPSPTASFTTIACTPTIDTPVITRNPDNTKSVKFTFWPAFNGNFELFVTNDGDGSVGFHSGTSLVGTTVTWNNAKWGNWTAKLVAFGTTVISNEVKFHVPYELDQPVQVGSDVPFIWSPPIHINPGMAIIVKRTSDGIVVKDTGPLPLNSTTYLWKGRIPAGDYEACLLYFIGMAPIELEPHNQICKTFHVEFTYPWAIFPLTEESCIKVFKEGKSGNAPFCAIYPNKFAPDHAADTLNVRSGECANPTPNQYQLNKDSNNVVCTFNFTWNSDNYNLTIPATGSGEWDDCDPVSGGTRTCYLTVGIWPDFRVPFLGQSWNNTLFSDVKEVLPTLQETGRPGVYSWAQPKVLFDTASEDPLAALLSDLVAKCEADPPIPSDPGNLRGCAGLADWASTHASQYPGLSDCFTAYIFSGTGTLANCLKLVTTTIIADLKKLPGQVSSVAGASTGPGGTVLGTDSGQKQRFIGAVDCGKHFTRDISLKPVALQQSLGIKFDCDLTASSEIPPGGGGGSPPPSPSPGPSPTPPPGSCFPASDGNPANGIETTRDELVCYISQVAAGKFEKKTGLPLTDIMIRVMDAESSGGNQCATPPGGGAGEIGIFQYVAGTWKTVGWDGGGSEDSGNVTPSSSNACWGVPGPDPVATTPPPPALPNLFNWVANFGVNLDGDAWNPYHQIEATAAEMEVSGGCPWSTFQGFFPGVCP